ncbi:hypothetical protein [Litoribacter populi]|uniref:hypothetical protein n=1 Tax=Litoribacter populi TaxID=2598460 RepID=UPI00117DA703|nr:hypothetical protein [Litoribacter populi]
MNRLSTIILISFTFFCADVIAESGNKRGDGGTFVQGNLNISVDDQSVEVALAFTYVAKDSARSSLSFWMDSAMEIQ